jgi:hypothetical protein
MNFPKHDIGFLLYHNDHKARGLDVAAQIEQWAEEEDDANDRVLFEDSEKTQRAIMTDELWELHWAPRTHKRLYLAASPTLEELLSYCATAEDDLAVVSPAIGIGAILTSLPDHESLELTHNLHKLQDLYAALHLKLSDEYNGVMQVKEPGWRQQMIAEGEIWEMSWVRHTGERLRVGAPSLSQLLTFGLQVEAWAKQRKLTQMLKNITQA